ncbi:hypothetical protein vBSscSF1_61 [Staphylococcus phage vB-SscS-F1]|nr:hypothetical protein vBApySJF1_61 [Arcanobacterium phage vB-ApyS-JF1]
MLDVDTLRALRGKEFVATVNVELKGTVDVYVCALNEEDAMDLAQDMVTIEDAIESDNLKLDVDVEGAVCYNG